MLKKIGNYNQSGNLQADMLMTVWSFKSFARKDEWQRSGYSLEQYSEAQELLKAKKLLNKAGALMPKTKKALSNAGYGPERVKAALELVIKNL